MTTTPLDQAAADDRLDHLDDGEPVYLPYITAGHYRREQPEASPQATAFLAMSSDTHPYSSEPMSLVSTDSAGSRLLLVAVRRLAHARTCPDCASTWDELDHQLSEIPEDGAISAGLQATTEDGREVTLIVDVQDMPSEWFTPEDEPS